MKMIKRQPKIFDIDTGIEEFDEKFKPKKKNNLKLSEYGKKHFSELTIQAIKECSTYMEFITNNNVTRKKQVAGNSCGNRFCPLCSYRKSRKLSFKIMTMMNAISKIEDKSFIFMTLTQKRVDGCGVKDGVGDLISGIHSFFGRKEIKKMQHGYIKKIEATYDKEKYISERLFKKKREYFESKNLSVGDLNPTYNTYHPHIHLIICVDKSYFTNEDIYLSRDRLLQLWQESMDDYDITQLDVRKVDLGDGSKENISTINEIAKYSAKDSDYLYSQSVFDVFYNALKGKQLITFSGIFRKYSLAFGKGELDDYKEKDETDYTYLVNVRWVNGKYESEAILIEHLDDYRKERLRKFMVFRE